MGLQERSRRAEVVEVTAGVNKLPLCEKVTLPPY